jgi:acyl-CoA synthetase (NDP forming)
MLDMAVAFLACGDRLPAGKRVGICTASGGGGVWMADACAAAGLEVPVLDDETRKELDVFVPPYGTSQNPVDSTAQGVQKLGYGEFARLVAQSPMVDSVVVVISARRSAFLEGDRAKLKALKETSQKPVLLWTYTLPAERSIEIINEAGYPLFTGAPGCARALAALADYRRLRERRLQPAQAPAVAAAARDKVRGLFSQSPAVLCEWQARPLLAAYGIGAGNAGTLAQSAADAEAAAKAAGGAVALKVQSAAIPHKTEAGAVALNVSAGDAAAAYDRVLAAAKTYAPAAIIDGVLVQPMAPAGREVILGINRDTRWGPLLMVGLGGVLVEAMGDVQLAPVPLDRDAAMALIARLKGAALLGAFRGRPEADVEALADLMVRLAQFASDHADTIAEIDLNPVIVHDKGAGVSMVDALIVKRTAQEPSRAAAE